MNINNNQIEIKKEKGNLNSKNLLKIIESKHFNNKLNLEKEMQSGDILRIGYKFQKEIKKEFNIMKV
jgi:hypothetical protein